MLTFSTESEAREYLVPALAARGLEAPCAEEAARAAASVFMVPDDPPPRDKWRGEPVHSLLIGADLFESGATWAIRDDDVPLLSEVVAVALAIGCVASGAVPLTLAAVVTPAVAVFVALRQLRAKGVCLNPLQRDVLLALKREPGLGVAELTAAVNTNRDVDWMLADVEQALAELQAIRLGNGEVVALVNADAAGLWSAAGV